MNATIRKRDTGELFDIPSGFVLEIDNTSPVFNELGSKSVTTDIPKSPHNCRLLGYPNRLDITSKPLVKIPVVVSDGAYIRDGVLYVISALNTTKSFSVTVAFDEGIMYEEMKSMKLTELPNLPVTKAETAEDMITYMNYLFRNEVLNEELTVFPIYLKDHSYTVSSSEYVNLTILNKQKSGDPTTLDVPATIQMVNGSSAVSVSVPIGYGITPFIKVWAVLKYLFANFGYTINANPFISDFQLNRLCVLNNTADAIVLNELNYAHLMPDITIVDFLKSLLCRFGVKVFVNSTTRTVDLRLLRDIMDNRSGQSLDINSLLDIDYTQPKQLRLQASKNLDRSSTETDTYPDFLKKYNYTIGKYQFGAPTQTAFPAGIGYDAYSGLFGQLPNIDGKESKLISSIHFDWDQKAPDMDYEELTSVDECLTQRFIGTGIYSGNAVYYAVDPNLLNSRLFVGLVFTESDNENKLAFAFDMGEYYVKNTSTGVKQYYGFKTGSIFPFYDYNTGELLEDKNGNIFRYALTFVGEHGCFNRFFKEYDSFLRHSNNIVKFELSQPLIDISHLDFFSKYMVDNQPLLFDKVKHIIGMDKSITAEARTLRLYEPYNTGEDHNIPTPNPILYKWVLNSNRSDVIAAKRLERETYWRSHPMVYEFISYVLREIVSDSYAYDNLDFWYLPPTQDQYDRQDKIKLPDGALELIYRLTYKTTGASHPTTYYDENFNLSYNIWFEPQPV